MAGAPSTPRRRITIWALFLMVLVGLFDLGILLGSFLLWLPSTMISLGTQIGGLPDLLVLWILAGPLFALIGLAAGWLTFFFRPRNGMLIGLLVPLVWLIPLIVLVATGEGRCAGGIC
ncbi:hypothetical protein [Hyphobacterium sp.]|uniref:hypothetical protein n=1 Tax=Hyphobacterium sp. TaxID=2004662 RepID=UPI003747F399